MYVVASVGGGAVPTSLFLVLTISRCALHWLVMTEILGGSQDVLSKKIKNII